MSDLITNNWGLKLLAIILALVVYHSLKTSSPDSNSNNERTIFQSDQSA